MKPLIRTLSIAAIAISIDTLSKSWAYHNLKGKLITVIPGQFHMILLQNPGGSFGIPEQYRTFAMCMPALLGAGAVAWLFQLIRTGAKISWMDELGIGLFLGGMLANFAERVMYNSVTDFLHVQIADFCLFNIADLMIDSGFLLFLTSTSFRYLRRVKNKRSGSELTTPVSPDS
jgi:signal peptidase II